MQNEIPKFSRLQAEEPAQAGKWRKIDLQKRFFLLSSFALQEATRHNLILLLLLLLWM